MEGQALFNKTVLMSQKTQVQHSILYEWFAPLYDLGVWLCALPFGGEGAIRERVIDRASPLKGLNTLEIFAGTGTLSLLAAERGASATAVDITGGMLRAAGFKAEKSGLKLALVRADASDLPFVDNGFDRVMVSMGLHETEQSRLPLILKESYRVLKSGGRLVIFDFFGAEGRGARAVQSLFFTFLEGDTAKQWVRTDLQTLLSRTGFRDFKREFLHSRAFQLLTVEKR